MKRYAALLCGLLAAAEARADYYKIYSPQVEEGEAAAEANLNWSADHRDRKNNYLSQVYGVEYGVTDFWATEISGEVEKSDDVSMRLTHVKWENVIAPFKPGEYWIDAGLYLEWEQSTVHGTPDNAEAGLLLEKRFGDFVNTANILFSRNFGPASAAGIDPGFSLRSKYHVSDMFEPGIEYYSDLGKFTDIDNFNRQDHVAGPVIQGKIGEISYDTGVLFGLSKSAPDATLKVNLEYDF